MSIDTKNNINLNRKAAYNVPRVYTQPSSVDFNEIRPVLLQPKRDLAEIFTSEFRQAVGKRVLALFDLNKKEQFVDGSIPFSDFHKKVEGISKLDAYISSKPALASLGVKYEDLEQSMKYVFKEHLPIDFDFESRKDVLDSLNRFASKKENEPIVKLIGKDLLEEVIVLNEDTVSTFKKDGLANVRDLLSKKSLSPLRKRLESGDVRVLLNENVSEKIVKANIEKLEILLLNPEYAFLKKNKCLQPSLLFFKGDMGGLFNLLKKASEDLGKDEKLLFWANPHSGVVHIKTKKIGLGSTKLTRSRYYDKRLKLNAEETGVLGQNITGKKTLNSVVKDFGRNTEYRTRQHYDANHKKWIMHSNTKMTKNSAGAVLNVERWQLDETFGLFNIKSIDVNGKIKTISRVVKNKLGKVIEKNLTSPSGDTTTYRYFKSTSGKKEAFSYIIKDKSGKVLGERNSLFKRISKERAFSQVNGEKFTINYLDDEINILNEKTREIKSISLKKLFPNGDRKMVRLLRTLSGPELIAVSENVHHLSSIVDKESHYLVGAEKIACASDKFIFEHELGHAKDVIIEGFEDILKDSKKSINEAKTKISSDEKLQRIFNAEKKKFVGSVPTKFKNWANYFVETTPSRSSLNGLQEAIAEINALLNTPSPPVWIAKRAHLLQENFPRTIAYLMKRL